MYENHDDKMITMTTKMRVKASRKHASRDEEIDNFIYIYIVYI